jgi:carbamoyltransferase
MTGKYILGISAFYHDSAAVLLQNEKIIAAAQEERFSRLKHDASFPRQAIRYCLDEAGIDIDSLSLISFYDKPLLKFERLLETYYAFAPKGFSSFSASIPVWIKEKLFIKHTIKKELTALSSKKKAVLPRIIFPEHHLSHAASAFYPSPFEESAILTIDGVGEYATATVGIGEGRGIRLLKQIDFPHSLGLLYTAFTYYLGFKVNSGEYKVMGLAPYGEPKYVDVIYDKLITVKDDGSLWINMDYFNYAVGLTMTNERFNRLFGMKPRKPESELKQIHMDIAASIQRVTEDVMLKMASYVKTITGLDNLCLAGGVALNCVANGKILKKKIFKDIWIQPAAGDAGGALGAAYLGWYMYWEKERKAGSIEFNNAYLGPAFDKAEVEGLIDKYKPKYWLCHDFDELVDMVSEKISEGKVVGWFQGRMEWGPRALGNRSILGDPRSPQMQRVLNLKIKFRESFRPFAPAVLKEDADKYFDLSEESPYMLIVASVQEQIRNKFSQEQELQGLDKLKICRSIIPAVTHVDYSARIQTVSAQSNPRFYKLIKSFKHKTGISLLINTSFNVRGEPIVCTPQQAYECFLKTGMDYLVIGEYVFYKDNSE